MSTEAGRPIETLGQELEAHNRELERILENFKSSLGQPVGIDQPDPNAEPIAQAAEAVASDLARFQHGRYQIEDMREAKGVIDGHIEEARYKFNEMMEHIKEKKREQHTACEEEAKALPGALSTLPPHG